MEDCSAKSIFVAQTDILDKNRGFNFSYLFFIHMRVLSYSHMLTLLTSDPVKQHCSRTHVDSYKILHWIAF